MNALSDVLRTINLAGAVFLDAQFAAPWSLSANGSLLRQRLPRVEHFIYYHYVAAGSCIAQTDELDPISVDSGHVVVFPHGNAHVMSSAQGLRPIPMETVLESSLSGGGTRLRYGGDGPTTRIVCGFLACDPRLCRPILSALPKLMSVDLRKGGSGDWMERTIEHSLSESASGRPGSEALLAKLSEVLFTETLRVYMENIPAERAGWLLGLRDPLVGRALARLHAEAAKPWTVDRLAREVCSSRSVLAERFSHFLGEPPMRYLARWRLALAAHLLQATTTSVGAIADEVGYVSETSFNRAFKRAYGASPRRWRLSRTGRNGEQ